MQGDHDMELQAGRSIRRTMAGLMVASILLLGGAGAAVRLTGNEDQPQPLGLMALDPLVAAADPAGAELLPPSPPPQPAAAPVPALPAPTPAPEPEAAPQPRHQGPVFDGRPLRKVKTIHMLVTAYSPDERSCGKSADGITASGYTVQTNGMKMVAADTRILPFKSIITVPGYHGDKPVPVLDRGGKIKGNRLDVLYPTHEQALQWGAQRLEVTVWEYAD